MYKIIFVRKQNENIIIEQWRVHAVLFLFYFIPTFRYFFDHQMFGPIFWKQNNLFSVFVHASQDYITHCCYFCFCFGNITLSKIVGSQCVLVLQLLCLAACVLKLFVYVRVCASCVLYVCVALSYFIW